jgi:hypothetical protein
VTVAVAVVDEVPSAVIGLGASCTLTFAAGKALGDFKTSCALGSLGSLVTAGLTELSAAVISTVPVFVPLVTVAEYVPSALDVAEPNVTVAPVVGSGTAESVIEAASPVTSEPPASLTVIVAVVVACPFAVIDEACRDTLTLAAGPVMHPFAGVTWAMKQ